MEGILGFGLANALMAGVLALAAAIVARVARRPALAHGLWLIVLVKLITPPLWSVTLPEFTRLSSPKLDHVDLVTYEVFYDTKNTNNVDIINPHVLPLEVGFDWSRLIVGLWAVGSVVWLVSAVRRIRRFQAVIRQATPASTEMQDLADGIAARLGLRRSPEVWTTSGAISPLVWAFAGPARLLVPEGLWKTLNHEQRCTLITHELAHLRRHDHWVRWLELGATAIYWWCPVLWWARAELHEAEEQCCDAWVIWAWPKAAKAYATALLETLDFLAETRPAVPLAASGAGHVRQLKRRVTMILRGLTPKSLSMAGRLTLVSLAALLLPLIPTLAQDPAQLKKGENVKDLYNDIQGYDLIVDSPVFLVDKLDAGMGARSTVPIPVGATKEEVESLVKSFTEVRDLEGKLDAARKRFEDLQVKVAARAKSQEPEHVIQGPVHFEIHRMPTGEVRTTRVIRPGSGQAVDPVRSNIRFRRNTPGLQSIIILKQRPDGTFEELESPEPTEPAKTTKPPVAEDRADKLKQIESQLKELQNAIKQLKEPKPDEVSNRPRGTDVRSITQRDIKASIKRQVERASQAARDAAAGEQKKNDPNNK